MLPHRVVLGTCELIPVKVLRMAALDKGVAV